MSVSPAKEYPKLLKALQETFHLAVNGRNYKRGAFRGQIDGRTDPFLAVSIFITSPLLTELEKGLFRDLHGSLIDLQRSDLGRMDPFEFMMKTMIVLEIGDHFSSDAKAQGMYVPPMTTQTYDPTTGNVTSTSTIDDDGNITETPGGRPLEIPGAPAAFNAAQAQKARDLGFARSVPGGGHNGDTVNRGNHGTFKIDAKHVAGDKQEEENVVKAREKEIAAKQEEIKKAKKAKRNAMERERKKRKQEQVKQATKRDAEQGGGPIHKSDDHGKNASRGADN
jgi:hypothetical protein